MEEEKLELLTGHDESQDADKLYCGPYDLENSDGSLQVKDSIINKETTCEPGMNETEKCSLQLDCEDVRENTLPDTFCKEKIYSHQNIVFHERVYPHQKVYPHQNIKIKTEPLEDGDAARSMSESLFHGEHSVQSENEGIATGHEFDLNYVKNQPYEDLGDVEEDLGLEEDYYNELGFKESVESSDTEPYQPSDEDFNVKPEGEDVAEEPTIRSRSGRVIKRKIKVFQRRFRNEYAGFEDECRFPLAPPHLSKLQRSLSSHEGSFDEDEPPSKLAALENDKVSKRKWTDEKEKKLCKLWEKELHLYDSRSKDYRYPEKRMLAFKKMAVILGMEINDIMMRIRTLRTAYTKSLHQPPTDGEQLTPRQLDVLERCHFLKAHLRTRKGHSSAYKRRRMAQIARRQAAQRVRNTSSPNCSNLEASSDDFDSCDRMIGVKDADNSSGSSTKQLSNRGLQKNVKCPNSTEREGEAVRLDTSGSDMKDKKFADSRVPSSSSGQGIFSKQDNPPVEDTHEIWAKLLAGKVREMEAKTRERFKLYVDTLAIDAIDGAWRPTK